MTLTHELFIAGTHPPGSCHRMSNVTDKSVTLHQRPTLWAFGVGPGFNPDINRARQ
jgi:hypothetical protein